MPIEYDQLTRNAANYVPLSPVSFLDRTADVYGHHQALIYQDQSWTWAEVRSRCVQIADSLKQRGIGLNDTVSVFAFNTPEMFESHFSIPMSGAVLNTINTRLDAPTVAYILDHAESKMVIVDRGPQDEWQAISLNYTSGTTGRPKGVVYHHRGSYLMTMGTIASWNVPHRPRYLYSVPMFHCNGWGHAWTMAAKAGTVVCLRAFEPNSFFDLLEQHRITHFGGAPIVLNMLAAVPAEKQKTFMPKIQVMTAGAPPPAAVLESMNRFGFEVMHVYGLTETYGHILQAAPQESWQEKSEAEQAELKSRQGVRFAMTEAVKVLDQDSGKPVSSDGETIGEIRIRGNTVMKGYLKNKQATVDAFIDDYFASGDLAVVHPDGYIQVKDRAKDIIISGGENISSVEVENTLYKHPAVGEAAVVAMPDEKWGEVPCAFVELKADQTCTDTELMEFCADNMARFKRPKKVIFGPLPKTATGKIQKTVLRKQVK